MHRIICGSSGQSMVQVLISFGLMSIMAIFFGAMQFNQHKQPNLGPRNGLAI